MSLAESSPEHPRCDKDRAVDDRYSTHSGQDGSHIQREREGGKREEILSVHTHHKVLSTGLQYLQVVGLLVVQKGPYQVGLIAQLVLHTVGDRLLCGGAGAGAGAGDDQRLYGDEQMDRRRVDNEWISKRDREANPSRYPSNSRVSSLSKEAISPNCIAPICTSPAPSHSPPP